MKEETTNKGSDLRKVTKEGDKEESKITDIKKESSSEENNVEKPKWKFGLTIIANETFTDFDFINEIEHDGEKLSIPPEAIYNMLSMILNGYETERLRSMVGMALVDSMVEVDTPQGRLKLKYPEFLSHVTVKKLHEYYQHQSMMKQNASKIIRPT